MCHAHHRSPLLCVLPPHILRHIAENGTPQERTAAIHTLSADQTLRIARAEQPTPTRAMRTAILSEQMTKQRTIYSAENRQALPGVLVRAEGAAASGDPQVDEAYDGLGATADFLWEIYNRNSIDGEGLPLNATVHFGTNYDNAFWNGEQMVFGDGDGKLFNRFTLALDVIGHELSHGMIQDEVGLRYSGQAGALNESLADVFGSLVRQYKLRHTAKKADWLIGAGLFTKDVAGVALRSMKNPGSAYDDPVLGKDPQPKHMDNYVNTYEDNGGVHINSGIPNHAFYLVAVALGGRAWEKAGRIWYETMRDSQLRTNSGFRAFARLTAVNAGQLYGQGSTEQKAVIDAWAQVGITVVAPTTKST